MVRPSPSKTTISGFDADLLEGADHVGELDRELADLGHAQPMVTLVLLGRWQLRQVALCDD